MLSTILTLLGGGLGGFLRFVPEIIKLFTEQRDRDHEYRMTRLQLDIDKARAAQAIDLVHAQGEVATAAGELQAYIEAIRGQSQLSGVRWVDAMNASVRPVVAYWWLMLYTIAKIATVTSLISDSATLSAFVDTAWTDNDAGVLSMILGFWYCDRSLRRMSGK